MAAMPRLQVSQLAHHCCLCEHEFSQLCAVEWVGGQNLADGKELAFLVSKSPRLWTWRQASWSATSCMSWAGISNVVTTFGANLCTELAKCVSC